MYKISGFQFYNTSEFTLAELVNDADHLADNFKSYINGFPSNIQDIIKNLEFDKQIDKMDKQIDKFDKQIDKMDKQIDKMDKQIDKFDKQIDKMDKHDRLLAVVKVFSELDLDPVHIDNMKMGYIVRKDKDFDGLFAMDRELLFKFLYDTQPDEMETLSKIYKGDLEDTLVNYINMEMRFSYIFKWFCNYDF